MKEAAPSPCFPAKPHGGSPPESGHLRRWSRTTTSSSSSSSSASFSSLFTTPFRSPSPFHRHHLFSPFHSASSAVPFSWEQQPGVPKTPNSDAKSLIPWPSNLLLPRPPPLRSSSDVSHSRKRPSGGGGLAADPFAVALAECAKDSPAGNEMEDIWGERVAEAGRGRRKAKAAAIAGRIAVLDLYGSCKAACSVAEATIAVPRSGHQSASYGLVNRRSG